MKKGIQTRDEMRVASISLTRLKNIEGNPYVNLANAIICVAVDDYRHALVEKDELVLRSIQHFFRSKWCSLLTNIDTEMLMAELQNEFKHQVQSTCASAEQNQ